MNIRQYNDMPHRGEIWLAIDRNKKHNGKKSEQNYNSSVQGGTRLCVVVSNDESNRLAPVVEIVYVTTKRKKELSTHLMINSTPEPSTVLCEQIMTIPKKNLIKYYGRLTSAEKNRLNRCLKISLGLSQMVEKRFNNIPHRGEIWVSADRGKKEENLCVVVSNNMGNRFAPVAEIVYVRTKPDRELSAQFIISNMPESSVVCCEAIMTIPKRNLIRRCGTLTSKEKNQLDKCLKMSLGL